MTHLIDGEFQSDKYPTCPRGKVPLSCKDLMAQDLLWEYAQRRRAVDPEFAADLETALQSAGYTPLTNVQVLERDLRLYGNAFELVHADGHRERLDPTKVLHHERLGHDGKWGEEILNRIKAKP
jgi:hypothetical protein